MDQGGGTTARRQSVPEPTAWVAALGTQQYATQQDSGFTAG
jgi:hypothetical protein